MTQGRAGPGPRGGGVRTFPGRGLLGLEAPGPERKPWAGLGGSAGAGPVRTGRAQGSRPVPGPHGRGPGRSPQPGPGADTVAAAGRPAHAGFRASSRGSGHRGSGRPWSLGRRTRRRDVRPRRRHWFCSVWFERPAVARPAPRERAARCPGPSAPGAPLGGGGQGALLTVGRAGLPRDVEGGGGSQRSPCGRTAKPKAAWSRSGAALCSGPRAPRVQTGCPAEGAGLDPKARRPQVWRHLPFDGTGPSPGLGQGRVCPNARSAVAGICFTCRPGLLGLGVSGSCGARRDEGPDLVPCARPVLSVPEPDRRPPASGIPTPEGLCGRAAGMALRTE